VSAVIGAREIYAFPSGLLLPEHCVEFGQALAQLWPELSLPAAVVLEPRTDPAVTARQLGAIAYDASPAQGVLSYHSANELIAQLRPLFLNAEPELFLIYRDDFAQVVARVEQYSERERLPNKARGVEAWLARVQASELCQQYAPLVAHGLDGRCFALERAS
jgi:hypothetical protein